MQYILSIILALFFLCSSVFPALAVENPLGVANNRFGIHILFPSELDKAAALVNSNHGDWGYIVIPIQSGDKDLEKWQDFMNNCYKLHLIPIIRLATEGDYFNTKVWRKPTDADVLDFANFLNSLTWPTKNRYIIVYNEVNRGDEWGGTPDPAAYANILSYAVSVFKTRSNNFFILSAGMDNAAATTGIAMNEYDYFAAMNQAVPGIFGQIDGLASHSYPNPAFSVPPSVVSKESITSFQFEKQLIGSMTNKNLPVFITETGWAQDIIGEDKAANYISSAYQTVWNTDGIVVVAPFVLQAGGGPFTSFSMFDSSGNKDAVYLAISNLPKTKGQPVLNPPQEVLALANTASKNLPMEHFQEPVSNNFATEFETGFKQFFKFLLQVH